MWFRLDSKPRAAILFEKAPWSKALSSDRCYGLHWHWELLVVQLLVLYFKGSLYYRCKYILHALQMKFQNFIEVLNFSSKMSPFSWK